MKILTKRTLIDVLTPDEAVLMLRYQQDNKAHLTPWEPARDEAYYTPTFWEKVIAHRLALYQSGRELPYVIFNPERTDIIGTCHFSNIIHEPFLACYLGYTVAQKYQGQGYVSEALEACLQRVFTALGLHRVMANYMPRNHRSGAVLERLGFKKEGLAESYLKINGKWEDHVMTSKINPDHFTLP